MGKKKGGNGGVAALADGDVGGSSSSKREQPLQAVLLADSFSNTFRPLSLDRPKVLCPLNNVTMMDYSIDFLASAGVQQLFIVCVSDPVESYVMEKHQQKRRASSMQIFIIKDTSLLNAGDALRELDRRDLVHSNPFILMFADTITNVNLSGAITKHKEYHKKDRSSMMTILFQQVGCPAVTTSDSGINNANYEDPAAAGADADAAAAGNPSGCYYSSIRSNTQDLIVGIDPRQDNRIVVYDDQCTEATVAVPCSFFTLHSQIDLHFDFIDVGIYLCSPDVLARFTDEFDYNDICRKFVTNSVAEEEEGLQNKIHAHVLASHEYAARIVDFTTYSTISQDLMKRWCYPIVPDHLPSGYEMKQYTLQRHYIYQEQKSGNPGNSKTRIGRSSLIHGPGMIGSSCVIGEECFIERSVIGNNCHFGFNVTLQGSHIWDNVHVEDGATIVQSVLADGCLIKAGAVISRGCVIGAGCVVGKGVVLPAGTRLTLVKEKDDGWGDDWDDDESKEGNDDDDDDDENSEDPKSPTSDLEQEAPPDKAVVGADGKGRVWIPAVDDEDEDLYGISSQEVMKAQNIGFDPMSLFFNRQQMQQEADDGFSDDDGMDFNNPLHDLDEYADDDAVEFGTSPLPSTAAAVPAQMVIGRQQGVDVVAELKDICMDYEATSPIENLAIELNSYKFSQNATYSDCVMAAILAILDKMKITSETNDRTLVADFKSFLEHWSPLLQKMGIGVDEEKAMVVALEKAALEDNEMGKVLSSGMSFRLLLQTLHDEEIASEEAVLAWAEERKKETDNDSTRTKLFQTKHVQDFLAWLEEEESEDGSDDDEGEEESEG